MLKQAVFSTIAYYSLNQYPLTLVEIIKFLEHQKKVNPKQINRALEKLTEENKIARYSGFYFLPEKKYLVKQRIQNQKLAVRKRRLLKKMLRKIRFLPFIQLICLSGSFNIDNSRIKSDFDFLVVTQKNKLWTTRAILTVFTFIRGWKRHNQETQNKICLNCFLTQDHLKITQRVKPHDFHSAQEYSRLQPLLENQKGLFKKLQQKNHWLKQVIAFYPWNTDTNFTQVGPTKFSEFIRKTGELLINFCGYQWLERLLGNIQRQRIHAASPTDQIYCSDQCLMLHPTSKVFTLLEKLKKISS